MTRYEFIQEYSPLVKELSSGTGIFPETVFAQAIIESSDSKGNFGAGYNVTHGNNYFGIRPGVSWKGEVLENPNVKSESKIFRAYNSPEDSIRDYFDFLRRNSRYKKAGVFEAENFKQQAQRLQSAGYAGNSKTYASLIGKVGDVVSKVLSGAKDFVSKHKTEVATSGIGLGFAVLVGLGLLVANSKSEK